MSAASPCCWWSRTRGPRWSWRGGLTSSSRAGWCWPGRPRPSWSIRTCARPTWATWRPASRGQDREPGGGRSEPGVRAVRRRTVRHGGGRAVARLRGPAGLERRARRAVDAGRLRQLLALLAREDRSVRLAGDLRAAAVPARRRPEPGALQARLAAGRGEPDQELAADQLRADAHPPESGDSALDGRRARDHHGLRRLGNQ